MGAVGLIVAAFLPWIKGSFGALTALDVPLELLWDRFALLGDHPGILSLGLVLIAAGIAGVAASMGVVARMIGRIGGWLGLAATVGIVVQLLRRWVDAGTNWFTFVKVVLGVGVYLALGASLLMVLARRTGASEGRPGGVE